MSEDATPSGGVRKRAVLLLLLAVGLVAAISSDAVYGLFLDFLEWGEAIVDRSPRLGALVFVLLAALSAMVAFFSSAVLVPVVLHRWGVAGTALLLWIGWILGGMIAYGIARHLGRPIVSRLVEPGVFTRYSDRITRRAPWTLVLVFQLAVPSEIPGYLLGLVRYTFWKYLLALALAELPYAVGAVLLGASLIERRAVPLLALGVAGAALLLGAFQLLQSRLRGGSRGEPQETARREPAGS